MDIPSATVCFVFLASRKKYRETNNFLIRLPSKLPLHPNLPAYVKYIQDSNLQNSNKDQRFFFSLFGAVGILFHASIIQTWVSEVGQSLGILAPALSLLVFSLHSSMFLVFRFNRSRSPAGKMWGFPTCVPCHCCAQRTKHSSSKTVIICTSFCLPPPGKHGFSARMYLLSSLSIIFK